MESAPCLLLCLLWGCCLAVIDGGGELRCYCNESGCVSTGYMCKSPIGQCYTAVLLQGETTRATHGCLDSVPLEQRGLCGGVGPASRDRRPEEGMKGSLGEDGDGEGVGTSRRRTEEKGGMPGGGGGGEDGEGPMPGFPLLICCGQDMCNYIENINLSNIAMLTKGNGTLSRGPTESERGIVILPNKGHERGQHINTIAQHDDEDYVDGDETKGDEGDRDLWFKAAVIAVPIAGGFILVLLVLLAVRMLRSDTQRHRRLIQVRRERCLTKAHLYVTNHFSDVSATKSAAMGCPLFPHPAHARKAHKNGHQAGRGGLGGGGGLAKLDGGRGNEDGGSKSAVNGTVGGGNCVRLGRPPPPPLLSPFCRDVNISVDRQGRVYEKVQCDVSVHRHHHTHPPASFKWSKPSSSALSDLATVV